MKKSRSEHFDDGIMVQDCFGDKGINFCLSGVCAQMSEQFVGTGVLDCPHKNEKFDQNHVDCL